MADIGTSYLQIVPSMAGAVKNIQSTLSGIDLSAASKNMGASLTAALPGSLKKSVSKAMDDAATAAKKPLEAALKGVTSAEADLAKAQNNRQKIVDQITKSEQKLSDLSAAGKENTKAYEQAQSRLADQQNRLAKASFDVAGAQINLESAQANVAKVSGEVDAAIAKQQTGWGKLAISAPAVSEAFKATGSALQSVGKNLNEVGGKLTKSITMPAVGAATAVGGLVTALGFKRLTGIENATQALKGLGYSAEEAARIMDGPVLSAVKGTAFGIADAGAAASGFLAGGMNDLNELSRYLKLTGDMAATGTAEYGHMAQMLQRIAAEGRVTGGDLTQMSQNGVYAAAALSDSLGISQEEVRKLASEGKISADQLADALENQIGGSALAMGETLEGATANTMAAIGRLGEKVWADVYPKIKDTLDEFMVMLDSPEWGDAASAIGEAISEAFDRVVNAVRGAIDWWNSLSPAMQKTIGMFAGVAVAAGPVLMILGKILSPLGMLISGIGSFVAVAGGMAAAFSGTALAANASKAATVGYNLATKAMSGAAKVAAAAQALFNSALLANPITLVVAAIAALVAGLALFFTKTEMGRQIWQGICEWFQSNVMPVFEALGELFSAVGARIAEGWAILWEGLKAAWEVIGPPIITAIQTAWEVMSTILSGIWDGIKIVFTTVWNVMKTYVETILGVIKGVISAVTAAISGDWAGAWEAIKGIFSTIWEGIKSIVETIFGGIKDNISSTLNTIKSIWTTIWNAVGGFFTGIWNGIKSGATSGIKAVYNTITGIKDSITGFFSNAGSWLVDAGRNIMDGFLKGLTAAFEKVKDFVGGIGSWIADHKGPKAYDLALLVPAGGWIMEGLEDGLTNQFESVKRAVSAFGPDLESVFSANLHAPLTGAAAFGGIPATSGVGAPGGVTQNFEVHTDDPALVAAVAMDRMRRPIY